MDKLQEMIDDANALHTLIYRYQNDAGNNALEVQKLTMMADDLREAIMEYKESLEQ